MAADGGPQPLNLGFQLIEPLGAGHLPSAFAWSLIGRLVEGRDPKRLESLAEKTARKERGRARNSDLPSKVSTLVVGGAWVPASIMKVAMFNSTCPTARTLPLEHAPPNGRDEDNCDDEDRHNGRVHRASSAADLIARLRLATVPHP